MYVLCGKPLNVSNPEFCVFPGSLEHYLNHKSDSSEKEIFSSVPCQSSAFTLSLTVQ